MILSFSTRDSIMADPSSLAQHRQNRRWTQADVAARAGVSRAEVSAIETGRLVPSVGVALKLAAAFDEPVEVLFGSSAARPTLEWAWPSMTEDPRVWRASVDGRRLLYPVEPTAAGAIGHDARMNAGSLQRLDSAPAPEGTLVIAGCDPTVGLLVRELAAAHGIRVLPLLRSSAQALDLLGRGLVHVAGLHLTDSDGRTTNDAVSEAHWALATG